MYNTYLFIYIVESLQNITKHFSPQTYITTTNNNGDDDNNNNFIHGHIFGGRSWLHLRRANSHALEDS